MTDRWPNRVLAYKRMPAAELAANPHNWRLHPDAQRQALVGVLDQVGQVYPLLYNQRTGRLIDGHLRTSLDAQAEWDVAIVELDEDEERLVLATLDPLAAMAQTDPAAFETLMLQVETESEAVLAMLTETALAAGVDLSPYRDTEPPLPQDPEADDFGEVRVKPGDLWLIESRSLPGQGHRLLCGDSTAQADVARLMDGRRAALFATDPPYLVDYDGTNHPHKWHEDPAAKNKDWSAGYHDWDDSSQGEALYDGFVAAAIAEAIAPDAAWYCWHASRRQALLEAVWTRHGAFVHQQIIWVKDRPVLTRSWYMWQHEPCFFGWIRGQKPKRAAADYPRTVWQIPTIAPGTSTDHPTSKPIEVFCIPMEQHTAPGEVCYEPFAGSGSQLVTGERLGRLVYALEIAPRYCEVTLRRLEEMGCTVRLAERHEEHPAGEGEVGSEAGEW